jgi:hypothetical protein
VSGWSKEARAAWRERNREKERKQWMEWRANNREKARASYRKAAAKIAATPEGKAKILARGAEYRKNNPEKVKASQYEYWNRPENKERRAARKKEIYYADHDKTKARQRRRYEKLRLCPMHKLHARISSNVRQSLTHGKKGATSYELIGYSKDQLVVHLERQFLPKMGWHNISQWHIDHIVPLASFKFDSAEDDGFKAAWALTNLRPVWAAINLRKHARREFLL